MANGGAVLEAAEVTKINLTNGRVSSVELVEGRRLSSPIVISSLDPHSTFFDFVGKENLPESLRETVENWKCDKWSLCTVHTVTVVETYPPDGEVHKDIPGIAGRELRP